MSLNICLISGHGYNSKGGYDSGAIASDGTHEQALNHHATEDIGAWLRRYGHKVTIIHTAVYQDLVKGYRAWNFKGFDYVFEVHFNAYNRSAYGTEIFVTSSEKRIDVEKQIMKNMSKYFTLRGADGVKVTDFLVIRHAKSQGVSSALVEICFIDNPSELAKYYKSKWDIHKAIADGIHVGFGFELPKVKEEKPKQEVNEPVPSASPDGLYRVQVGAFKDYKNAQNLLKELESKGYKPFISK